MQNFALLRLARKSTKPILLKRGVRTFVNHSRNTLDISAIPVVQKESHLPLIIDLSHAAGVRDQVAPLSLAATAAGADGLIVEVHHQPENALSDGAQSLYPINSSS
jgi:3-deoxy-7-phosphoheptulonate synthase